MEAMSQGNGYHTLRAAGGPLLPRGLDLTGTPLLNKGTAFTERERDALGLRGLLPARVFTIEEQVHRVMTNLRRLDDPLQKYVFLTNLQNRNEILFYRVLQDYAEEMIPIIYTPTVGQACLEYGAIFRQPRGLFVSIRERGRVAEVLRHWPYPDVRMIVVTDGERILGLGDLGALGMGIPVGKLSLYTACAGLHPSYCLPVTLDVGTDNESLHVDPLYIGLNQKRVRGAEYDAFLEEFVSAVQEAYPLALLQWEDFGNQNAFRLLEQYRQRITSFNDDIQGTAAVAVAGIIAALQTVGGQLRDQRILFLGAGEAGTGIADLFVEALGQEGVAAEDARRRCVFVDSQGMVVRGRPGRLAHHKAPYAHDMPFVPTLAEAVEVVKPTVLVGVSGTPRTFTREIVERMAALNERPIVFALSNPTSKAECTAEAAYVHTDGRCLFASGSPFPSVHWKGQTFQPGQGNNVYIFPGVGLGAIAARARTITDGMFLTAAKTLASMVLPQELATGNLYPSLSRIREVSGRIALEVAQEVFREGLSRGEEPADLAGHVESLRYEPDYRDYV